MFITIDASRACTRRSASRRPVHGRKKTTGGKGGKGGNLKSAGKTGPGRRCRDAAETGGNRRELVFAALWRRESIPGRAAGNRPIQ